MDRTDQATAPSRRAKMSAVFWLRTHMIAAAHASVNEIVASVGKIYWRIPVWPNGSGGVRGATALSVAAAGAALDGDADAGLSVIKLMAGCRWRAFYAPAAP